MSGWKMELSGHFFLSATATNESLEGDKITVRATDIPGNHADMEKAI
jgi:hypothetical protein